jgi:hypothetical protein
MLVTKAIRDPSGEKLGELADPTFAIRPTDSSTPPSSTTGLPALTSNVAETDRAALSVATKTIRAKLNCASHWDFMILFSGVKTSFDLSGFYDGVLILHY